MTERTFNQINQQESSAYMNGSRDMPTVLIDRKSGDVTVARLDKHTRTAYFTENGVAYEKPIALENLSDARQEELAAKLAGRALRGTVEVEPDDASTSLVEFDEAGLIKMPDWIKSDNQADEKAEVGALEEVSQADPLEELNPDVRAEVLLYRRAVQNKRDAEREKNFALAAEDGRAIYRVEQTLSPAAKAFLKLR